MTRVNRARPLVIAHRGSSVAHPEHTLAAYRQAIDEGADGLECDVRLTRDGHLVCVHDRRLERTSNGKGLVSAVRLAELELLDFGSWHAVGGRPASVLTLDQLLATAVDAGRPLRLLIETKHPTRFGAMVERRLVELLEHYGLTRARASVGVASVEVSVMSFSPFAVRRIRLLAPELETVFLFELAPPRVRDGRLPFGAHVLGPGISAIRAHPEIVARAQARGHQVYVWTVNDPADIDLARDLGVDAIISDCPAFVLSRVAG